MPDNLYNQKSEGHGRLARQVESERRSRYSPGQGDATCLLFPAPREREGQFRPLSLSGAALAVSQDLNSGCPINAFFITGWE